jgi:Ligated ion channel L-glutamate- and glycine-binding site
MLRQAPPGVEYKGNDAFEGYCADLAAAVAKIVNFEYLIRPVKDGNYGKKLDDGSWNGMIGELIREVKYNGFENCKSDDRCDSGKNCLFANYF